jgi:hypothetical protein
MTELERALVALGRDLDVPEAPDVVAAVGARIGPRPRRKSAPPVRRWVLAVALLLLAALAATLALPDARSALFRALHIGGARIELVTELPELPAETDSRARSPPRLAREARRDAADPFELDDDRVYLGDLWTVWSPRRAQAGPFLVADPLPLGRPGALLKSSPPGHAGRAVRRRRRRRVPER